MKKIAIIAFATLGLVIAANATDLTQQITLLDGKPITDAAGKPAPMSVGTIIKNTLLVSVPNMTEDEKKKNFWLAIKIGEKKEITFTPQELSQIEAVLWKYQTTLVAGQVIRIIDQTSEPATAK